MNVTVQFGAAEALKKNLSKFASPKMVNCDGFAIFARSACFYGAFLGLTA
jgi:hypothetical protein